MNEHERLKFLINRDGKEEARRWALCALRIYRQAVLKNGNDGSKPHFASNKAYRHKFISSYLCLKQFALGGEE